MSREDVVATLYNVLGDVVASNANIIIALAFRFPMKGHTANKKVR
jgi:hypothetical protein